MNAKFFVLSSRFSVLLLQFAAFWAVWHWYAGRLQDSGGENWSLLALAAAVLICCLKRKQSERRDWDLAVPTIFVLCYALSFAFLPPLVRAIIAVTGLAFTLSRLFFGQFLHPGIYALLLLALPLVASLNFFLGFPLRVVIGEATAWLLRLNGLAVWREGVCLHFGEKLIWIDAPCSGIKMLWFGTFLTAIVISFLGLNFWRSVFAFAASFLMILLGNVFRAAALFYVEAEIIRAPGWTHEAVGVFAFVLAAAAIVFVAQFLRKDLRKDIQWHAG
jgi:exosortase/archaeosortase family protein